MQACYVGCSWQKGRISAYSHLHSKITGSPLEMLKDIYSSQLTIYESLSFTIVQLGIKIISDFMFIPLKLDPRQTKLLLFCKKRDIFL